MNPFAKIGKRAGNNTLACGYELTRAFILGKMWTAWGRLWTFDELLRLARMPKETLVERLRRGWKPELAVTAPVKRPRRSRHLTL